MKRVLIISSWVAASQVGARTSAFALNALGIETVILPTTQMGRHPGWGLPGGGVSDPARLRDLWSGVGAQDLQYDAVLTGYMGHIDHIVLAGEIITAQRKANRDICVLVDPIMGDHPDGLYVDELIAHAIKTYLVPLADIITPNLWELDYITDHDAHPAGPGSVVVTSVPMGTDGIGAQLYAGETYAVSHPILDSVPRGSGDLLAALYLGHIMNGLSPKTALTKAVMTTFETLERSVGTQRDELILVGADLSGLKYDV